MSEITGTDEFDNRKIEFTFSPNPTESNISIDFNNSLNFKVAKIYNLYGELLLTTTSRKIDLLDLSTGYYIVQVITDEGMASKLLIKK
ncbi:MAG: T9SS type A sorting domain-containing protein [Saprospiraceae bacterium]|nr:T9SS type A sorting domain-containing protein [Saprospiraceae bacterium]